MLERMVKGQRHMVECVFPVSSCPALMSHLSSHAVVFIGLIFFSYLPVMHTWMPPGTTPLTLLLQHVLVSVKP